MRNHPVSHISVMFIFIFSLFACSRPEGKNMADQLNTASYEYHYRNLDSSLIYAKRAYNASESYDYSTGKAEALNNEAFVYIARMEYDKAYELLHEAQKLTDNQIEQLVTDVQFMRLCQRQSRNKDFYFYRESAITRMKRIEEEHATLSEREHRRYVYAQTEYSIVLSTYLYYIGLTDSSVSAIESIDPNGDIVEDTAQLLNYYYNIGAGGIIQSGTKESICQAEFNYLMRCYLLSRQYNYPYWEANSLQAISEHLLDEKNRDYIIKNNPQEIDFVNVDKMPDSLLAGNIARRSLHLFESYGDVYQTAGAYRTLGECYLGINDYSSALICLNDALGKNVAINDAPDLVASIREQLSLAYAALGDKKKSFQNRRIYLEMQEKTRQDRQLEARADQLNELSRQLNLMIVAVVLMIIIVVLLLFIFNYLRRKNEKKYSVSDFLRPLEEWKSQDELQEKEFNEQYDEIKEQTEIAKQQLLSNKKRNLEQRAKISLANGILPLINRMEHEVKRLIIMNESDAVRKERYEYLSEITDKINEYNDVLTRWIQMHKGELSLHIESFELQKVFNIVSKSRMEYKLQGIDFQVEPTTDIVKADKVLTLFMINTIAENARRFTPPGGRVVINSRAADDYVEIAVTDTGCGIEKNKLENIFSHNIRESNKENSIKSDADIRPHGFGLMNCKGIIDKYKKISSLFRVCTISVESELGKGSRFYFRLPKGIMRIITIILFLSCSIFSFSMGNVELRRARVLSDSAHNANLREDYHRTLIYADSCMKYLNKYYLRQTRSGRDTMTIYSDAMSIPAELVWFYDSLRTDYSVILNIRNECAIAAIGLQKWDLYEYNNNAYTKLFREKSADNTLSDYVHLMQESRKNKNVAIIMLSFLFVMIFPAYYFLYYRHRIYYNLYVRSLVAINKVLLSDETPTVKLREIKDIWNKCDRFSFANPRLEALEDVVNQIKLALQQKINLISEKHTSIEYAEDELQKAELENNKMHISNSVLDNCLSTLKHETMYYPSRIKQLIDGTDRNLHAINDTICYYKELYTILSAQSLRQIEVKNRIDYDIVRYLFEILKKMNGGIKPDMTVDNYNERYVNIRVFLPSVKLNDSQRMDLFSPTTIDIRFLLCKQIVREVGEITNARACGIQAVEGKDESTIIEIILTKLVWTNLKL